MLSALLHLVRSRWTLVVLFASKIWRRLLYFAGTTGLGIDAPERNPEIDSPNANDLGVGNPRTDPQGFPALTDDQYGQLKRAFIESLDPDLICSLASRYNNGTPCRVVGKKNGSFNVCFFVEFDQEEELEWIVRVLIEPALDHPWAKLVSEVTTMQYLERNTRIPVPHVHAYGCDALLTKDGTGRQMFLISDLIPGKPLDKKLLIGAEEEQRRNFYSGLIDILTELRKLEFSSIGSLIPSSDRSPHPVLGPVMSMSAATLRLRPRPSLTSALEYMQYQLSLVLEFFSPPVGDHTLDDIKQEIFALHGLERIFNQTIDPQLDKGPFVLNHPDLRSPNIIVDEQLRIQGIIDWEFASTVPRQVFAPPSWITGHDSIETNKRMHSEFHSVLDVKSRSDSLCDQLKREWYDHAAADPSSVDPTDLAFCIAHVLRRPTDAADIYCDFLTGTPADTPVDDLVSDFFNNHQDLLREAQRRAAHCQRYAEYLKENGLYETELDRLLAASAALKAKLGR